MGTFFIKHLLFGKNENVRNNEGAGREGWSADTEKHGPRAGVSKGVGPTCRVKTGTKSIR